MNITNHDIECVFQLPSENPITGICRVISELGISVNTMVEIGVASGNSIQQWRHFLPETIIHGIDPWIIDDHYNPDLPDVGFCTELGTTQAEADALYASVIEKFSADTRIIIHRGRSTEHNIPPPIDLVYIDGSHDHEAVLTDIRTYLPRIREGGLLCGHDMGVPGVTAAVLETIGTNGVLLPAFVWITCV